MNCWAEFIDQLLIPFVVCNPLDRSAFNANLFQLFKKEYDRIADPQGKYSLF